jgi:type IV pilus modification protein PilV
LIMKNGWVDARLQGGFSLVEVLVAAVIFSIGLGGLSLMMLTSLHGTVEARNYTMATIHASSLAELILLNPSSLGHYINPSAETPSDCLQGGACSDAAWAAGNLARWQFELEQNLARSSVRVCLDSTPDDGHSAEPACDNAGQPVVKVFWSEPRHLEDSSGGLRRIVTPVTN